MLLDFLVVTRHLLITSPSPTTRETPQDLACGVVVGHAGRGGDVEGQEICSTNRLDALESIGCLAQSSLTPQGCSIGPDRFLVHSERNISYFISTFPTSMVKVEMLIVEMFLPLKSRVLRHVHSLVTKVSSLVIPSER